ncbi:MAG: sugar ABC transporter permease, partial [Propionibacteriaceae bacterium]
MSDSNVLTEASQTTPTTPSQALAPRKGSRRREEVYKVLFVVPAALAIVALFGYPVVKNLMMSFQDYSLRTFFTGKAPWVG